MRKIALPVCLLVLGPAVQAAPILLNPVEPVQKMFDSSKYDEVIKSLSDAEIEKLPRRHRPQAYILLGESHQMKGRVDKALGVFQVAAQLFPEDINILSRLAGLLQAEGLDDRARPIYDQILKLHPHNAAAHFGIARIEHSLGFWESAADHYRQCLGEWKDNAGVWRNLADVLIQRRDYKAALDAIDHSLGLDPDSLASLKVLSLLEFRQGMHDKAYRSLDRALAAAKKSKADPVTVRELSLQYSLWLLEDGDLEKSLPLAQSVLRENPGDSLGLWIRGLISVKRGRPADARRDLQAAANSERDTPFVAHAAREALKQLGNP